MDVQMPVYLYDVTTAIVPPRVVVTLRNAEDAQALAARLNELRTKGLLDDDAFTVAPARSAVVTVAVPLDTPVVIGGYTIDTEAVSKKVDPSATKNAAKIPK